MSSVVSGELTIRSAIPSDVAVITSFVRKLADFEKLTHEVVADEARLGESLFGDHPVAEVLLAFLGAQPAGFAVFFKNFSTFLGRPGVYLEDLFVEPEHRGRGIGKSLLAHLAKMAVAQGAARLEWAVLDWNEPAIAFYQSLGAVLMDTWTVCRLSGDALLRLAQGAGDAP
jgi:GNAT superfamily N-acetyltransferase